MSKTAAAIFKASGRGFQRIPTLNRKFGIEGTRLALLEIEAQRPGERCRIFGREAGGIGPK